MVRVEVRFISLFPTNSDRYSTPVETLKRGREEVIASVSNIGTLPRWAHNSSITPGERWWLRGRSFEGVNALTVSIRCRRYLRVDLLREQDTRMTFLPRAPVSRYSRRIHNRAMSTIILLHNRCIIIPVLF